MGDKGKKDINKQSKQKAKKEANKKKQVKQQGYPSPRITWLGRTVVLVSISAFQILLLLRVQAVVRFRFILRILCMPDLHLARMVVRSSYYQTNGNGDYAARRYWCLASIVAQRSE